MQPADAITWQTLVQIMIAGCVLGVLSWMQQRTHAATIQTQKTTDAIHMLVNSEYGKALRIGASALTRIAELPGATPSDRDAAKEAQRLSMEHDGKQSILDARSDDAEI